MERLPSMTLNGFIFFILIICVGYITAGDLSLKTKRGSLERTINYIATGVIVNFGFLVLSFFIIPSLGNALVNFFSDSGKAIENIPINNKLEVQVIIFSLGYFVLIFCIKTIISRINKFK